MEIIAIEKQSVNKQEEILLKRDKKRESMKTKERIQRQKNERGRVEGGGVNGSL